MAKEGVEMATFAEKQGRLRADRIFYTTMGVAILAVTIWGFARSYYFSRWIETPAGFRELNGLLHLHGALFTAFILLFVIQPALIATRNVRTHRQLGAAGAAMAAAMVLVGNYLAIASMNWPALAPGDPFAFYAVPFFAINMFGLLMMLAILNRNRPEAHKRLILLASTQLVEASVARVPLPMMADYGPYSWLIASNLVIIAGIAWDLTTRGRIHSAWLWGGVIVLASQLLRLWIAETEGWLAFARMMAGLY